MKLGFFSLLTLIFITLKLTGVIAWSWWLVLLPAFGWLVVLLTIAIFTFLAAVFAAFLVWVIGLIWK